MNSEDQPAPKRERPRQSITCEPDDEDYDPAYEAWLRFRKEDGETMNNTMNPTRDAVRLAVEADVQQMFAQSCTPDRGYDEVPIDNTLALVTRQAERIAEYDAKYDERTQQWADEVSENIKLRERIAELERKVEVAKKALYHERGALMIVRDRQGGAASIEDINKGISLLDDALAALTETKNQQP